MAEAGEAYVCTRMALRHEDYDRLDATLRVVNRRPGEMLRGVISALAWQRDEASAAIEHLSNPAADTVAQVAALRAVALLGTASLRSLAAPLEVYLSSASADVRTAACRAAAIAEEPAAISLLRPRLESTALTERAEAAIALIAHNETNVAWRTLRDSVLAQAQLHATVTGWHRNQSARRLRRWVMELAWASLPENDDSSETLSLLPPRAALTFALCRGDLGSLPFVAAHTATPGAERYAGWVWQALSGVDLSARGWVLPEPDPSTLDASQLITEARLDADDGLPLPDPGPINAYSTAHAEHALSGKRVLMGRELDCTHALDLIENGPQAFRLIAARALRTRAPKMRIDVRAPATIQRQTLLSLQHVAPGREHGDA